MALHELPLEPRFLHGHFSRDLEPVLTVDPGDTVLISTPNHAWQVERDEEIVAPNPEIDTGHALAGPIEVRGARAGQTLVVRIEEVRPSHWGVTHGGKDHAVYWDLRAGIGRDAHQIAGFEGSIADLQTRLSALESSLAVERSLLASIRSQLSVARTRPAAVA